MRRDRRLRDAQHEAAHVVVGVALGLRLERAEVGTFGRASDPDAGYVTFLGGGAIEAYRLMFAAGIAWERRMGDLYYARTDLASLRRERVRGNARVRALEIAAWSVLECRAELHDRIARALISGAVTAATVRRICTPGSDRDGS